MGWASGSSLLNEVAEIVMPHVPEAKRADIADALIEAFRGRDCDTIDECQQTDIKAAYERIYPPEEE